MAVIEELGSSSVQSNSNVTWTEVPYGWISTVIQFSGPDNTTQVFHRKTFHQKAPESAVFADENLTTVGSERQFRLSLIEGDAYRTQFNWVTITPGSFHCSITSGPDVSMFMTIGHDCSMLLTDLDLEASGTYTILLVNGTGIEMDRLEVVLDVSPKDQTSGGFQSVAAPIAGGGFLMAVLVGFLIGRTGRKSSEISEYSPDYLPEPSVTQEQPNVVADVKEVVPLGGYTQSTNSAASSGPSREASASRSADGFDWIEHNGQHWYRQTGSEAEWIEWTG